jgi:site-specific recombinase XerD
MTTPTGWNMPRSGGQECDCPGDCTRRGGPIERTEDWRVWKAILRQAQVRDARVHDARHTAATLLIEQGVHIRVVQEVLGHTRVTTTERYTHVATLQMKDASERMGQALWGER